MMTLIDQNIKDIENKLLQMAEIVQTQIADAIKALLDRDSRLAEGVMARDRKVNSLDVSIDEDCIKFIALRQPKAKDLREIITMMKMTSDLERIGDMAVNICERVIELNEEPPLKPYIDLPRMAMIAKDMVKNTIDAFLAKDKALACKVIKSDDDVDLLMRQIANELTLFMIEDPKKISRAVKISYITKYIERIADHAVNMAEMIIYLIEGKIIRHTEFEESNICKDNK